MKYYGIMKKNKPGAKLAALFAAAFMLMFGFVNREIVYIPVALLIIAACFMKKEQVISEDGVDVVYNVFGMVTHNSWNWNQIKVIRTERKRMRPNVQIHFAAEGNSRLFLLTASDCENVLELAARMNPHIEIKDDPNRADEARGEEILHRQEVERAQTAAKKRRK